jgi:hypothetical protein
VKHYLNIDADLYSHTRSAPGTRSPVSVLPLVLSVGLDGDDAFYRAYPPDSVMPFWLKGEAMFNVLDWLLNCGEPDAYAGNVYARCGNDFEGGSNGFRARVRLDRLEYGPPEVRAAQTAVCCCMNRSVTHTKPSPRVAANLTRRRVRLPFFSLAAARSARCRRRQHRWR